jgi:hypothetical protein
MERERGAGGDDGEASPVLQTYQSQSHLPPTSKDRRGITKPSKVNDLDAGRRPDRAGKQSKRNTGTSIPSFSVKGQKLVLSVCFSEL